MLVIDQKDHARSCIETLSLMCMHRCWQFEHRKGASCEVETPERHLQATELDDQEDIDW